MHRARYDRNRELISEREQERLTEAVVAVVGLGGLGGHSSEELARMGIGHLILIDFDVFDESNLNRQLFATEETLGHSKAEKARERLTMVNSDIVYSVHDVPLTSDNARELLLGAEIVVDALDSIPTRLILKDACRELGIPLVYGAIGGWYGQVSFIEPGDDTLDLLYPDPTAQGIEKKLGNPSFTPALVASIQVAETLKYLLGKGNLLKNKVLLIDLLCQDYQILEL